MRTWMLLFTLFLFTQATGSPLPQRAKADSLAGRLASVTKADTAKASLLLAYAKSLLSLAPDSAEIISNQAIILSKKLGFSYGVIKGLNIIAISYWYRNNVAKAIPAFHKALDFCRREGQGDLESMVANNLGVYYIRLGFPDSALKYNLIARDVALKINNRTRYIKAIADLAQVSFNLGNFVDAIEYNMEVKNYYDSCNQLYDLEICYMRIALIYSSINDFQKSIQNYHRALQINEIVKDASIKMMIYQNIGLLYIEQKKNLDSATYYLQRSLDMAKQMNAQETILAAQTNLGNIALKSLDYQKSIAIFNEVLSLPLIPSRNKERASIWVSLGSAYQGLNKLKEAEYYTHKAIMLARELKFQSIELIATKTMAELEAKKGNYASAYHYYVRHAALKDSLGNSDTKRKIDEIIFTSSLKAKEQENLILQQENINRLKTIQYQRYIIIAGIVVLLLGAGLLLVIVRSSRRQKKMNSVLDLKNKELSELNITKDKFFSIIAHDLKSPFNGLLGLLTELDENYDDLDEISRHRIIGSLKRSSHNTFNLLVNLLDWSRSQQGQLQCHPVEVLLDEIVQEVVVMLAARALVKSHQLVSQVEPGTPVFADPQILRGMLLNLVNNAIKFTPSGGNITIVAIRQENRLMVEVTDTGIGIPPEEVEKLFRIDMQFKRRGTENEPGTGLGLVMCKEFSTLMGGEIGVTSTPGVGSTFYFTIPGK